MAISTEYFDIVHIGFPVSETTRPSVLSLFEHYLLGAVNMVYIQYTQVVIATAHALAAEIAKQFNKL